MTDYERTLAKVTAVLALADATGADHTWTAHAILTTLRQLATDHNARYIPGCGKPNCPGRHMITAPFADLLTDPGRPTT